MHPVPPVTRRLLLRRFAAAAPVFATFVLPEATFAAMSDRYAEPPGAEPQHPPLFTLPRRPIQERDPHPRPHALQPHLDHTQAPSRYDHLEAPPRLDHAQAPPRHDHAQAPPRLDHAQAPPHLDHAEAQPRHDHAQAQPRHARPEVSRDQARSAELRGAPHPPVPLVMLDPGHGGKDPGAIGYSGTYEKHVALAAALELKRQLEAKGRYRVVLTRTRDVFIPLDERVELAEKAGAALFVSMHADALSDHSVRGASVYTLAETPSDLQTAHLAQRENSADRFIGRHGRGISPEVERVLANLVRRETRAGSLRMASSLVGSLGTDLPMLPNPERHAGFAVLKAADIPSVLVEMGFMSNPRDEAALRRADHRHLVAQAMYRAVDAYFTGIGHMA